MGSNPTPPLLLSGSLVSFGWHPSIHDRDLAVTVLSRLYEQELTDRVESQVLYDRIAEITKQRHLQTRELLKSAEAGELRESGRRKLP